MPRRVYAVAIFLFWTKENNKPSDIKTRNVIL